MNSIMRSTTSVIEEAGAPSSIPTSGAQTTSNDRQAASTELTLLDEVSLCWVAGGPGGSIGIIGR